MDIKYISYGLTLMLSSDAVKIVMSSEKVVRILKLPNGSMLIRWGFTW